MSKLYMIFDVESVGLHGEGFAVGYVVINESGDEVESGYAGCPLSTASEAPQFDPDNGSDDRAWVKENVVPHLPEPTHRDPVEVREFFWAKWLEYSMKGASLWAYCGWPVEANFLIACLDNDPLVRKSFEGNRGPYPFHEIASVLFVCGLNPLGTYPRNENELPAHNPLNDARQSARILMECLDGQRPQEVAR